MDPVSNATIDHTAMMIGLDLSAADIRENLLSRGLSEYNCYLCYKAAQLLLNQGFYTRKALAMPDPFKK